MSKSFLLIVPKTIPFILLFLVAITLIRHKKDFKNLLFNLIIALLIYWTLLIVLAGLIVSSS